MLDGYRRFILLIAVALFLTGCAAWTKTPYARPEIAWPAEWNQPFELAVSEVISDSWWHSFNEPRLNDLVRKMLSNNSSLESAAMAVRAAEEALRLTESNKYPFRFSASQSHDIILHSNGGSVETGGVNPNTSNYSRTTSFALSISRIIDIWGTLRDQTEAAKWRANASREDWKNLVLRQVGMLVVLYGDLAFSMAEINSARQSLLYTRQALDFSVIRHRFGVSSLVDRLSAEQALTAQTARLSSLEGNKALTMSAISVLLNEQSLELDIDSSILGRPLPRLMLGLPSYILEARPDLRAAELRLRASLAEHDALCTSYFPFSADISIGSLSGSFRGLLDSPLAGLNLAFTLPNIWGVSANIGVSEANYWSQSAAFKQELHIALNEVERALTTREVLAAQAAMQARSAILAAEIEKKSALAYKVGAISFAQLLDAQEARQISDAQINGIRNAQWANQVDLYLAVGGRAWVQPSIVNSHQHSARDLLD